MKNSKRITDRSEVELTVLLPAFNEGSAVAAAVEAHHRALSASFDSFEIIVIDDASTDDTSRAAQQVARRLPFIRVHRNVVNLGQAASLRVGFELACGRAVLHNAIDLPFSPDDVGLIKRALDGGADVVVVERETRHAYGLFRKVISRSNVLLLRTLFRCPVKDYNFVQAYRNRFLRQVEIVSTAAGSVTPELIVRAYRAGFRVTRVSAPYHVRRVGRSTVRLRHITSSLAQTLGLAIALRKGKHDHASAAASIADVGRPSRTAPSDDVIAESTVSSIREEMDARSVGSL